MSSDSDDHSRHSSVPLSAQPYRSLFGGSSQGAFEQDYSRLPRQNGAIEHSDFGAIGNGGQNAEYSDSEVDLAYLPIDDEASESETGLFTVPKNNATNTKSTSRLLEIPRSSSSPPPYRPNRFHGPADLWLQLTRDDREIVNSLEEIRARDLAAHLYNAHVLQSRGAAQQGDSETQNIKVDDGDLYSNLEEWTAWPMPSDEVPRADERIRRLEDDKWTFRMKPDSRPSAWLEESIAAILLKIAKERFRSRKSTRSSGRERKGPTLSDTNAAVSGIEADMEHQQIHSNTIPHSSFRAHQDVSGTSIPKSDPDDDMSTAEWGSDPEFSGVSMRPVIQIDDDEARRKLRPLSRNVIVQLEHLLHGLHSFHGASRHDEEQSNRSRSRGRKRTRSSSGHSGMSGVCPRHVHEGDSEADRYTHEVSVYPRPSSSVKGQAMKPVGNHSRGRKRPRRTSQSPRRKSVSATPVTPRRPRSRSTSTNSDGQPRLTDWRDVAGIASMIGISPAVLQRATERFCALTGDDQVAPSMPEEAGLHFIENVSNWLSTEGFLTQPGPGESLSRPSSLDASNRNRSTQSAARAVSQPGDQDSSGNEDNPNKIATLVCPFKKCRRHTKGFSRRWNLNQHLKTMHPSYNPTTGSRSQKRSGMQSGYDSDMSD
ncbi:RNA polymerase I-specific transcription initiation factor-domain-containing protein [Aspergillus karnatakaensis]|uniref:uncharacterized protein n=1 Tax=Aspergillus karnatakaensis TaxID=1810916 RepID=UPI003CCD5EC4